jgi:hypothetical protein
MIRVNFKECQERKGLLSSARFIRRGPLVCRSQRVRAVENHDATVRRLLGRGWSAAAVIRGGIRSGDETMRSFLLNSGPSLLLVATLAIGGYIVLAPPAASADRPDASELPGHMANCAVCRLAPFGHDNRASRFGPAPASVTDAEHAAF